MMDNRLHDRSGSSAFIHNKWFNNVLLFSIERLVHLALVHHLFLFIVEFRLAHYFIIHVYIDFRV